MNNEIKKEAIMVWFVIATSLFIFSMIIFVIGAKLDAENNYLKQQIEEQKIIIKQLKEGK